AARLSAWQDGANAAILDQHGSIRPYLGLDAVDQVRMRKDRLHYGLFRLKLEILGSNSGVVPARQLSALRADKPAHKQPRCRCGERGCLQVGSISIPVNAPPRHQGPEPPRPPPSP